MMCIETCQEGVILSVRACPGAKRNEVRGEQNGFLKVCVTQIPEKGKANEAVRKQLAETLKLRISQIELLQGETSSQKKFLLRNVCAGTLQKLLQTYCTEPVKPGADVKCKRK